jgi:hypothetical protein
MNPMKYPQSYLALEAAQFDRQPRMAPPLTWDDREAEQIPSYEQTAISPDPLIDLGAGFSGGFGANIMRKGLSSALRSGIAATLAEYPIGLATAGAANIDPRLAMPVSILGGMASGPTFERALSNAMAGRAHPVRTAQKALGNAMGQVDVWHGSPHSFDRFSMDKIGTGEGHQAFGYGLYFTDMKGVAKHYAETLGGKINDPQSVLNNFHGSPKIDAKNIIKRAFEKNKDPMKEAIVYFRKWKRPQQEIKKTKDIINKFIKSGGTVESGSIYKASLHKGKNPSEYVYLDWDKPVGLNKYKKAIKQAQSDGIRAKGAALIPFSENLTGNRLYADIVEGYRRIKADNPQREASLFLKRAGIDGIRYPSGSLSGGSGKGKNYVVFDENAITIEERKALGR